MSVAPIAIDLPTEIRGPRLLLRPYRLEDAPALWVAVTESRDHLAPWMPWVHDYRSPEDARAFVAQAAARWLLREDLTVGLFAVSDGRYLGSSGLHRIDWVLRTFEIGYWIRKSAEGQGYISEAVALLARLAFDSLAANRVEIRVDPENRRSVRVAEGLGFILEGTLRRCAPGAGEVPADRQIFALVPEDFRRLAWAQSS